MRVLIACEESQVVCQAFRDKGHEAYSCDILETSGDHPEWHYQSDVIDLILSEKWDMMIAFPPCTHLCVSGARWFKDKQEDGRQQGGIDFFMSLVNAPIDKIAIENPIGIMSKLYRKPDQIVHPYYFGDDEQKSTCFWLKNLPKLEHSKETDLFNNKSWVEPYKSPSGLTRTHIGYGKVNNSTMRSKTFQGIANQMAEQWG